MTLTIRSALSCTR
jgi:hypothetical protein